MATRHFVVWVAGGRSHLSSRHAYRRGEAEWRFDQTAQVPSDLVEDLGWWDWQTPIHGPFPAFSAERVSEIIVWLEAHGYTARTVSSPDPRDAHPGRPERMVYGLYRPQQSFSVFDAVWVEDHVYGTVLPIRECRTIGEAMHLRKHLGDTWMPGVPGSTGDLEQQGLRRHDPYDWSDFGPAPDGGWPPTPTRLALDHFPDDAGLWNAVLSKAVGGRVVSTAAEGPHLHVPLGGETALRRALRRLGVTCTRDDDLVGELIP